MLPSSLPPFWFSSHQCHLTAREWTLQSWSFVASFQFGLGDPPGMGGVPADSIPSHGLRRTQPGAPAPESSVSHMSPPSPMLSPTRSQISFYIRTNSFSITWQQLALGQDKNHSVPSNSSPSLYPSFGESLIKCFCHSFTQSNCSCSLGRSLLNSGDSGGPEGSICTDKGHQLISQESPSKLPRL